MRRSRPYIRCEQSRAFVLVEALVALAVLLILSIAVFELMVSASKSARDSVLRSQATLLSQEVAESILSRTIANQLTTSPQIPWYHNTVNNLGACPSSPPTQRCCTTAPNLSLAGFFVNTASCDGNGGQLYFSSDSNYWYYTHEENTTTTEITPFTRYILYVTEDFDGDGEIDSITWTIVVEWDDMGQASRLENKLTLYAPK